MSASMTGVVPHALDGKIPTADFLAVHYLWLARLLRLVDEVDEPHFVLRADNQIHPRYAPQRFHAHLRITPRYHHIGLWRVAQHGAHCLAALGLSALGHRARIDHADVRLVTVGDD